MIALGCSTSLEIGLSIPELQIAYINNDFIVSVLKDCICMYSSSGELQKTIHCETSSIDKIIIVDNTVAFT